jgi:hypothetical protein
MNLIAYGWPFLSSGGGNFVTSTTVLNMPPTDIFATAELTGVMILDGSGSGAVGFTGYTTVDPTTQVPTQVDLTPGEFFMCIGMFSANNVDSVTLFIDASDGGTATFIQGSFQIYSMP